MVLLLASFAAAKDKKNPVYPLAGVVVSFHAQPEVGGEFDDRGGFVGTDERRVYVVKTDSGTIEITGLHGRFRDRTGALSLAVGQKLNYRLEKTYAYTVLEDGKEHRFYVLSSQ